MAFHTATNKRNTKEINYKQMRKIIITLIAGFTFIYATNAQQTRVVTSNSLEFPGKTINIKWVSENIIYPEGVNIYRKTDNNPIWKKLNNTPYKMGTYQIPDSAFDADSALREYIEFANEIKTPSELTGIAKVFFMLEMVYSNEFSKYIGVQFDDEDIEFDRTYQYMIKRVKGDKELFEGISEPIIAGTYIGGASPEEVRVEGENKKVNIWWKIDNERFHSINIYRYTSVDPEKKKINTKPIVLAKVPQQDGSLDYPKVYFTDFDVRNDTNYFYSLVGIDFFGRETQLSDFKMASPRNRRPPPAPELKVPDVELLDVNLNWIPNDTKKIIGYNIYRTSSIYREFEKLTDEMLTNLAVRFHDKVDNPGNYYYYVASVDKNNNEGKSNMVMAEVMDIYPPPVPQNLTAAADSGQITLSWDSVKDEQLLGYRLYRTVDVSNKSFYALMNAEPIKETTYVDKLPFNARNSFFYVVVAVDSALNMSDYSSPASAVMPDVVPPDAPFIKEIAPIENSLQIKWLPNLESDLLGYHLYRNNQVDSLTNTVRINNGIIPIGKTSFVDLNTDYDITYHYYLKAIDSVGNLSAKSNLYPAKTSKQQKAQDFELRGISAKPSPDGKQVKLSWQTTNSNSIKGVVVFRKSGEDENLKPVSGLIKENNFNDKLTSTNQSYYYVLIAYAHNGDKWNSETIKVIATEE